MGLLRVMNSDLGESEIHYDELFYSMSIETDSDDYISIMNTNLNALLII